MLTGKKFGTKIRTIRKFQQENSLYNKISYKGCFKSYLLNISFSAFAGKNLTF